MSSAAHSHPHVYSAFYTPKMHAAINHGAHTGAHVGTHVNIAQSVSSLITNVGTYAIDLSEPIVRFSLLLKAHKIKSRTSLWRHKSKPCTSLDENTLRSLVEQNNVIIQQNSVYQKQVMDLTDVIRESSGNNIVINSTQTHNKNNNNNVSINVFLNEQCKDAINFEDFINQIQVTRDDIVNNAEVGFIDGMCDIMTNNLDKMPLQIRPIHCTDLKRKIVFGVTWTKYNDVIDDNMNKAV